MIYPFLATIPDDPYNASAIGWWCVIAAAVAFGINQVWELVNRARGDAPHPPNSQLESDQKDLRRRVKILEEWKDTLIEKLDADKTEIMAAGALRETNLTNQITAIGTRVDDMQDSLAKIPNEFMALLANAKNLLGGKQ